MPDYRAVATRVALEIRIEYPPEVRAAVAAAKADMEALAASRPWARWALVSADAVPEVEAFITSIPSDALRDEFARKAKKLDVGFREAMFGLSFSAGDTHVVVSAQALRRA
jgi:hypothetical protein